MHVGNDFFKWMNFIIQLIRIFIQIFGDDDEKEAANNNDVKA